MKSNQNSNRLSPTSEDSNILLQNNDLNDSNFLDGFDEFLERRYELVKKLGKL